MPALLVGLLPLGMTLLGWNHFAGEVLYTPLHQAQSHDIRHRLSIHPPAYAQQIGENAHA